MAKAEFTTTTIIHLFLNEEETKYLIDLLHNDLYKKETDEEEKHRLDIFDALYSVY